MCTPPHVFTRTRRSVWKRSKASGRRQSRRPFSRTERPSRNSSSRTVHRPALRHRGSSAAAPHGVPAPSRWWPRRWWAGQEEAAGISCDNGQRGPGCLSLGSSQETLSVWDPGIPDHHSATWREPSPCHSGRDFFRGEAFCPPPPHPRTCAQASVHPLSLGTVTARLLPRRTAGPRRLALSSLQPQSAAQRRMNE